MKVMTALLILALLACSTSFVAANTEETEVTRALAVLANAYPALRSLSPPWVANYTGGGNLCSWSGITCNGARKIVSIILSNLNLNGPFVQEWFNFTSLTHLELRNVGFNGAMPSEIENMSPLLATLIVTDNLGLGGNFPMISNLVGPGVHGVLSTVDFSHNGFVGPFPNYFLSPDTTMGFDWLAKVDFSHNAFSGPITIDCNRAPAALNLRSNSLSGTLTSCNWPVTSTLDLSFNNFEGDFPTAKAKYIDISHNKFTSVTSYMASISFVTVQSFEASFNLISTPVPSIQSGLNAYLIDLSHNDISGPMDASWNSARVKYLTIHNNRITSLWPTPGSTMASMIALDASNNPITSMPDGFASFGTALAQFFCTSCQLSGGLSAEITELPVIQQLKLGGNMITGDIEQLTFRTSSLSFLDISDNQFTGIALSVFRNLSSIMPFTELYLQGNSMTMCDAGAIAGDPLAFNAPSTCYADQTGSEVVSPACTTAWNPCHLDFVPIAPPIAFVPPVSPPTFVPLEPSSSPLEPSSPSSSPAAPPSRPTPAAPPTSGSATMAISLGLILAAFFAFASSIF